MFDQMFSGLFDGSTIPTISLPDFLMCVFTALVAGALLALFYCYKSRYTRSFLITIATIPAVVCVVIMLVNGNIGTGVAVAGAFSLVRFRSVPGTAKEIGAIFLAMGAGLAAGMGYLAYAILFVLIMCIINMIYVRIGLGEKKDCLDKTLRITIPEGLDYTGVFDDLFEKYTSASELICVKTTNMGSLYKLTYNMTLKDTMSEKEFIDLLRCRNGNLEINISRQETNISEL